MNAELLHSKLVQARDKQKSGDLAGAEGLYRQVLKADRNNQDALHLLGMVFFKRGQYGKAIDYIERAIRLREHTIFYSNLATAYQKSGDSEQAEENYRRALELNPDNLNAVNGLANILGAREDLKDAADLIMEALERNGDFDILLISLGNIFARMRRYADALDCFGRALKTGTSLQVPVFLSMARLLGRMGRTEEAKKSCMRVLEKDPDHRSALYQFARLLHDEGRFDEAIGRYEELIEKHPDYATAWRTMVLSRKWTRDDNDMEKRLLLSMERAEPLRKSQFCFALGKFYNDRGEYDRAFSFYREGNRIIKPCYDHSGNRKFIEAVIEEHRERKMNGPRITGHSSARPIFVVGMPRSGTTLVSSVLSGHPRITNLGELLEISILVRSLKNYLKHPELYPQCIRGMSDQHAARLAERYLSSVDQLAPGSDRVIDKLPQNFINLGFIEILFPNATIIHCRRNPLDTCLSCYFQFFFQNMSFAFDLEDLANYYRLYQRLMDYWSESLSIPLVEVEYEDMVTDLPSQARRLIEACSLEWDDRCLDHRGGSSVRTASRWQVRQPIYTSSMNRWKNYRDHIDVLLKAFPECRQEIEPEAHSASF